MKRHELLDTARAPDGTALTLHRHDGAYYINAAGVPLMSSRRHASEDKLAELACASVVANGVVNPSILIGGLGLGYTLRAALRVLPADARVVVVEIMPDVIRWNTDAAYAISDEALRDPRVELVQDDVARVIAASRRRFDAIILDVDNGAEAMTTANNAELYREEGIRAAIGALRDDGVLAYWASDPEPAFERALRAAGRDVAVTRARAHTTSGPRHFIYLVTEPTVA